MLPFANAGMDPGTEYFADGLTDELTDLLGRTEGLRVVARSSAYQYKGKIVDARQIGDHLKAGVLLEGSVRKEGQSLRVTTQLIDAHTGYQIWSQTSEREWTQVFAMQQAIAASIAAKLRVRPAGAQAARRTPNLESYNLYLKGRFLWNKRTVPALQSAIATFREAIGKDPNYAAAWAGLADSYSTLGFMEAMPPRQIHQEASEAAERAVQLDDTLAEAHVAQATVRGLYDWDWSGSERSLRRAVQLNPNLSLRTTASPRCSPQSGGSTKDSPRCAARRISIRSPSWWSARAPGSWLPCTDTANPTTPSAWQTTWIPRSSGATSSAPGPTSGVASSTAPSTASIERER